jgi:hypothetical protein
VRNLILCLCSAFLVAVALPSAGSSQDTNGSFLTSISGGYTYDSGHLAAAPSISNSLPSRASFSGWNASVGFRMSRYVGIIADFDGVYGSPHYTILESCHDVLVGTLLMGECASVPVQEHAELFTFLGGVRVAPRPRSFNPFFEALFGGAVARVGASFPILPFGNCTGCSTQLSPALAVGGGLAYRLSRRFDWYLRADLLDTLVEGLQGPRTAQYGVQASTGISYRLCVFKDCPTK